jgi:hypothetical protein
VRSLWKVLRENLKKLTAFLAYQVIQGGVGKETLQDARLATNGFGSFIEGARIVKKPRQDH